MLGRSSFAALCCFLSACGVKATYPAQCGSALPGWKTPSEGYGVLAVVNKVHLLSDGSRKWNGKTITGEQLAEYSAVLPTMSPIPFTILDVEAGAPCGVVIETRRTIDEQAKCRAMPEASRCGEGPEPWALVGDVIGPDGKPPKPFYPEPSESNEGR
jgi:hypothetical protein